ncbi:BACON domain-containing protein [Paraflavitalea sp. CAU 1676]|uniref:BACON domain-containing protein n=1 Tax=Paraflavitalea sp. CAU 1676 TaxID=3032598 RepID=UPI0023DB914B|nr:BACON domain-containing protein [Paraflavitalea sp. CAU 1676]MDF2191630.1 BACON domain-containing protein [Paraflavitalea sp. CAU 1676]
MKPSIVPSWKLGLLLTAVGAFTACKKNNDEPSSKYNLSVNLLSLETITSGGEQELVITSNTDWKLSGLPEWLTTPTTEGNGNATIKLTVAMNAGETARTAALALKATDVQDVAINITQKGLVEKVQQINAANVQRMLLLNDGYLFVTRTDDKYNLIKIAKDGQSVVAQKTLELAGMEITNLSDIDTIPGGGFALALNIKTIETGLSNWSAYLARLSPTFEIVKGMKIDHGIDYTESTQAVAGAKDGIVLVYSRSTTGSFQNSMLKYDFDLNKVNDVPYIFNQVNDLYIAPDESVIVAGVSNSETTLYKLTNDLSFAAAYEGKNGSASRVLAINGGYLVVGQINKGGTDSDIYCTMLDNNLEAVGKEWLFDRTKGDRATSIIALSGGGYALSGTITGTSGSKAFTVRLDNNLTPIPGKELVFDVNTISAIAASTPMAGNKYSVFGAAPGKVVLVEMNP